MKTFIYPACVTIGVLLIPLVAMQFTTEMDWTLSDFVVMGIMLFVASSLFILPIRKLGKYGLIAAAGIVFLFLWLWAELAVGVFTNWGS